jgi:hypothetical protein
MKEQQEQHQEHQNQMLRRNRTNNGNAPPEKGVLQGDETPRAEPLVEDTTSGLIDKIKRKISASSSWKEKVGIVYNETSSTIRKQTATVSVPSAILGASVTAVAWVASNRRSGQ